MVILEAATAGVPTLTYDVSPAIHRFVDPDAGFLVEPGDEGALVRTLGDAMSDRELLAVRGEKARQRAQEHSVDNVVRRWAALITDCYTRRGV